MTDLFEKYIELLNQWNKHINLVQADSLKNIKTRHIDDCLQLVPYLPTNGTIFDIGSGAGFPGLILAIAGFNNLVLIEKDVKKAVFLKEIKRKLNLNCGIYNGDVYLLDTKKYKKPFFAVSRAFGSLPTLIYIMKKLSIPNGLFHRGKNWQLEITLVHKNSRVNDLKYEIIKSSLTSDSILLKIQCC